MEGSGIDRGGTLADETKLYRYVGLSQFVSFVERKQTYLTRITCWQDTWEAPAFQIPTQGLNGELKYSLRARADDIFGQSWSLHSESDAMWRVYSPQEEGLVIQTTVRKFGLMSEIREGLLAEVIYFDDLEDTLDEIGDDPENPPYNVALFKRKAFEYEAEVRLITLNHEICLGKRYEACERIYIALDPIEFVESITVDPRSKDWYVDTLRRYCARSGFSITPRRSGLYSDGVFESTGLSYELSPIGKTRE